MIEYLLDTNACIAIINGTSVTVRSRLKRALAEGGVACVSTVVLHELWHGVATSTRRDCNAERVQMFLAGPLTVLEFDDADARAAGVVRAELERQAVPIGAYDVLIAGQAVRRAVTLVTANTREFARVEGLTWEDWSGASAAAHASRRRRR